MTAAAKKTADGKKADAVSALVPLLAYQSAAVTREAQFTWNNWSRQVGKSFGFALRRVIRGMKRNRNQILLSAGERQSRELMEKVRLHVGAIKASVDATTEDLPDSQFEGTEFGKLETIVRHQRGAFNFRIIALPANPLTARGYTGDLLLDEFAMHRDDREIWSAVYPIALRGGGEIDICSTPKGRKNLFYKLAGNTAFATSTVTIDDAIADGLDVNREQVRRGMGDDDLFRQEFLCEFLDEATAFLTFEMIAQCEDVLLSKTWDDAKRALCANEDLFVGVDVGRHRDLTVIWIWGKPAGTQLLLTRGIIEMSKARFAEQEREIVALLRQPNVRRICMDATGMGEQMSERMGEAFGTHRAEPVKFTMESKSDLAGNLRIKVEDRTVRVPVDETIRNDWHSIERQVLPGGSIRYSCDRGGTDAHADRFWAAALGVRAATQARVVPFKFEPAGSLVFGGKW